MLEAAANANLVSTISLKRNTPFLQPPTSGPADYPSYRDVARYPSKETMGARRMDNDHRGLLHLIAELGCMPQRYPDPDRGHCWGTVGQYFIVPFGTRGCRPKGSLYRRNPQSGRGRSNSAKEIADLRADGTPMKQFHPQWVGQAGGPLRRKCEGTTIACILVIFVAALASSLFLLVEPFPFDHGTVKESRQLKTDTVCWTTTYGERQPPVGLVLVKRVQDRDGSRVAPPPRWRPASPRVL
jgi:hypothetical protein